MNLADIRQKAQQAKADGRVTDSPPAAYSAADEIFDSLEGSSEIAEEPPSLWPSLLPARAVNPFDPLSVLLAGRATAGCHSEIPVEMTQEETAVEQYQEFLCFRVSDELYAINIMEIKEIIKPREITEVPRVPAFVSGVLSLRGLIIPVFNMHERLGLTAGETTGKERIIVVKKEDELSGLQVDEVIQVVRIAEGVIEQPPAVLEGIDREFVNGVGRHDGRMLILLNMRSILDIDLM